MDSPYQMVNISTGLLIVFVFAYSAVYSSPADDYPIECAHLAVSGLECSTCGLSRSFSEMVRGNYHSAAAYNKNGPLLFGFFASQLFIRSALGIILYRKRNRQPRFSAQLTARADAAISLFLFVICFRYLLVFW
jgi:hypothetical protein